MNRWSIQLAVCFAFIWVIGAIFAVISSSRFIETDDSYYYIITSLNYISFGFPTFDGIVETNGFHPLYFYTLSALYYFFDIDKQSATVFAALFNLSLYVVGIAGLANALNRCCSSRSLPMLALIMLLTPQLITFIPGVSTFAWLEATEFGLSFLAFSWFIYALVKFYRSDSRVSIHRNLLILVAMVFILFFVRTDYPILVIPMVAYACAEKWAKISLPLLLKKGWSILVPLACIVLLYLVHNYKLNGHFEQISGLAKKYHASLGGAGTFESFPRRVFDYISATIFGSTVNAYSLLLLMEVRSALYALSYAFHFIATLTLYVVSWKFLTPVMQRVVFSFLIGFVFFISAHMARGWIEVRYWYFAPVFAVSIFIFVPLFDRFKIALFGYLILSIGILLPELVASRNEDQDRVYNVLNAISAHCEKPLENLSIATPNAGLISYLTDAKVINLDGLVNDFRYLLALRNGNASQLLEERGADIILLPAGYSSKAPYNQFISRDAFSIEGWDMIPIGDVCSFQSGLW